MVPALVDASGPVLTGVLGARVVLELASDAGVGVGAGAVLAGAEVLADAAVHAGRPDAPLGRRLAVFAVSSFGTSAAVKNIIFKKLHI